MRKKTQIRQLEKLLGPHLPGSRGREPAIILCLKGETPKEAKQRYYEDHPDNQNPTLEVLINLGGIGEGMGKPKEDASDLGQQVEMEPPGIHDPDLEALGEAGCEEASRLMYGPFDEPEPDQEPPPPVEPPKINPFRAPIVPPQDKDNVSVVSPPAARAEEPAKLHKVDRYIELLDAPPEKQEKTMKFCRKSRSRWDWMR